MYQRKVYVDMLNAVESELADVSSAPLRQSKELFRDISKGYRSLRRSTYPHQPYVDTLYNSIRVAAILELFSTNNYPWGK